MKSIITRPATLPDERIPTIEYYTNEDFHDEIPKALDYSLDTVGCIERKKKRSLMVDFATFDIETTTIKNYIDASDPIAFPYLFQFYVCGKLFFMRDRTDFILFIENLCVELDKRGITLICYVHNLSFEWQFIKAMLHIDEESVFALQTRRIAKFTINEGAIEFRCSYLLSNMSLEKFTQNYATPDFWKDKELIDYEIARYPWTQLDDSILYYSAMDCIGLYHAIKSLMNREGDSVKTIPMTNTGYVRRSCREACLGTNTKHYRSEEEKRTYKKFREYRKMFNKLAINLEQYKLCERAFRGGNTHANRFKIGQILENVGSYDFASSYPAITIACDDFPMGKLEDCTKTLQDDPSLISYYARNYWLIIECLMEDIELRDPVHCTVPYIPVAKVTREASRIKESVVDNGRIISQPGYIRYAFLGCEWDIIKNQYKGRIKVTKAFYSPKGHLPHALRMTIFDWYKLKTELKDVDGKEYEYMKSKNRVNSTYGMMVERIIKEVIEYKDGEIIGRAPTPEEEEKQISDYYTPMQRKFLQYTWGITVTAMARVRLQEMIDAVGEDFVYADTDSCKFEHAEKYENWFKEYNAKWCRYANSCSVPYIAFTPSGKEKPLGVADREPNYDRFVTLGAKKYAVEQKGKLEITIAGVPKKIGAKMLGRLENFKPGYRFYIGDNATLEERQDWKKRLTYSDEEIGGIKIEGHDLYIGSFVAIERTSYDLDITPEYESLTGFTERYIYEEDHEIWAN